MTSWIMPRKVAKGESRTRMCVSWFCSLSGSSSSSGSASSSNSWSSGSSPVPRKTMSGIKIGCVDIIKQNRSRCVKIVY